jgi:hypothetical protein
MQPNASSFITWLTNGILNTPEPVVLLALGGLFLVLSFRRRVPRVRHSAKSPATPSGGHSQGSPVLVAQKRP